MSRARSTALYLGAAALAIAVGAAAALLRPAPVSDTSVKLRMKAEPMQPQAVQEPLLEALIEEARAVEDVERLPAFDVALALFGGGDGSARERLLEPDVPQALALALAKRLPRRGDGPEGAAMLLERHLAAAAPGAVAVVKARGEAEIKRDVACRCSFARYGDWAVAWGPGLGWSPERVDGNWVLNLRAEPGGAKALTMRLEGGGSLSARPGEGPRIAATAID